MNTDTHPNPSVTEILHALIPALILFLTAILADPARPHSPAMRRAARTLRGVRALAALFGIAIPQAPAPATRSAPRPKPTPSPARSRPLAQPAPWYLTPGPHPEPTRTLEL